VVLLLLPLLLWLRLRLGGGGVKKHGVIAKPRRSYDKTRQGNAMPRSQAQSGWEKKERKLGIANLMVEKAAKLDRDTFGVAVGGQGPWQRRLEEIGGIKPLAFGQFGEMGPGLEAPLASC
jgi:hypothetical protein